jgi:hypothetical protein
MPLFVALIAGTQQRARYKGKPHQSKLLRCIKPAILSKACFIAPSLITSTPGSRSPLAANLMDKAICIRQCLMSRTGFGLISNAVSLRMVLLATVVMLAVMIFWWPFHARGAAFAHRAIQGAWSRRRHICRITCFRSCLYGDGCCRYPSAYAIFCRMIPRHSIPHCGFFSG